MLPVSAFAACVYAINRLMQESELVVMQATGFSAFRLARPVLYFGLSVAMMHLVLTHVLVPMSQVRLADRSAEVSENVTARFLNEGRFMHPTTGITLYIRKITPLGELRDIFLSDERDAAQRVVYTAEKALLVRGDNGPNLVMLDGVAQRLVRGDNRLAVTRFQQLRDRSFKHRQQHRQPPPEQQRAVNHHPAGRQPRNAGRHPRKPRLAAGRGAQPFPPRRFCRWQPRFWVLPR